MEAMIISFLVGFLITFFISAILYNINKRD